MTGIAASKARRRRTFRQYPSYKTTGLDWLDRVPSHWPTPPLYARYSVELGKMLDAKRITGNYLVPYLRNQDVQWDRVNTDALPEMDIQPDEYERFTLRRGDLLVCEGGEVGRTAIWNGQLSVCAFQKAIHRLRPLDTHDCPRFLYYVLRAAADAGVFIAGGNPNTIPHLTAEKLRVYRFPLPDEAEQKAIAGFLDRETAKVDALVEKEKRLIELLKEKRAALISHAVTKGLNPDVPMKDSGIEWLGQVPEHWKILKLTRVTIDRCDGPFGSGLKSEHYTDEGVRVIRLQNIRHAQFDDSDQAFIAPEYYAELGDHDVEPDDLLVAGLGDENNSVGRACVAPSFIGPAMVKADCFRFRLDTQRANPSFVAFQLSSTAKDLAGTLSSGTTRMRMNLTTTASRDIVLPLPEEQDLIVRHLKDETSKLDRLVLKIEDAIARLLEYRTALISAAVTGKIDVRGEVAQ